MTTTSQEIVPRSPSKFYPREIPGRPQPKRFTRRMTRITSFKRRYTRPSRNPSLGAVRIYRIHRRTFTYLQKWMWQQISLAHLGIKTSDKVISTTVRIPIRNEKSLTRFLEVSIRIQFSKTSVRPRIFRVPICR